MNGVDMKEGFFARMHVHETDERGIPMEQLIAEHVLGRPLRAGETIRHANGNTLDNRRANLLICVGNNQTPLERIEP